MSDHYHTEMPIDRRELIKASEDEGKFRAMYDNMRETNSLLRQQLAQASDLIEELQIRIEELKNE